MCWTCNINKLKAQIAKKDINVYKIVKKATKEYCISPFMDYTYYSKDIQPSLAKGIVRFKSKYITYSKIINSFNSMTNTNVYIHSSDTKALKAIARLMNIAKYYNGDWKPDWSDPSEYKYFIVYNSNIYKVDYNWTSIYDRIYFKNKKDAQSVIDNPNFRDILDAIYKN